MVPQFLQECYSNTKDGRPPLSRADQLWEVIQFNCAKVLIATKHSCNSSERVIMAALSNMLSISSEAC